MKNTETANEMGLDTRILNVENPRKEIEEHYYNPDHRHLLDLGYEPTHDVEAELRIVLTDLVKYRSRIESRKEALIPDIRWDGRREQVKYIG